MNRDFSSKLISTLEDLISINSINPMFSPYGKGEAEVAQYLEQFFSQFKSEIIRQPVFPGRDNIIIRFPGRNTKKTLIFEAHMDTVSCDLTSPSALVPTISAGVLYGRGACDTKGSLAAMIWAIRSIIEDEGTLPIGICFVGTVDEEHKASGINKFIKDDIHADGAIVGEPTGLKIVIAHKGCYRFVITTRGRAAHSSIPENGINAIYKMVDLINALRLRIEPKLKGNSHVLVGKPTLNVGLISGGKEVNTVPDFCSIEIDRRIIPGENQKQVEGAFEQLLRELNAGDTEFLARIEEPFYDPPLTTSENENIVSVARTACETILGKSELEGVNYGSDASKLSFIGIPSIVLGPGDIKNAHSDNENIALYEVIEAFQVYRKIIFRFSEIQRVKKSF